MLTYKAINIIFTTFCVLIVINGSNFIDGLNGLVIGYYLIILTILFNSDLNIDLYFESNMLINFAVVLTILLVANFFNKVFLGDNGSYLIGFLFSIYLIRIHQINTGISPYFIILLLWYPCFEILFSIVRKINFNRSPLRPDNKHLHQVLFIFIKKITKRKKLDPNTISANIINLYNLIILYLGSLDIYNSQYQIFLILVNLIFYVFTYLRIVNNINKISITSLKKKG